MNTPQQKIEVPLLLIGVLVLLTGGVSLLPASWFGIKQQVIRYEPLNLGALATYGAGDNDANQDGTVSWKEFIAGSLGMDAETASTTETVSARDLAALNDPNNLTSSFTKNYYIAQVALKQSGITDAATQQQTVNELLSKEAAKIHLTTYSRLDVKVASTDTVASLTSYGNSVASILQGVISQKSMTNDLQAITKFIQEDDEADLIPLMNDRRVVNDALDKLLKLKVPESAVAMHVSALNAIGAYASTLSDMAGAYDDPIRATFGLNKYMENATAILKLYSTYLSFFKTKGVVFTSKDAGYIFVTGYTGN